MLDIRVSQIVDSDTLDPCGFCASVHLPVQIALVDGEDTVFLFQPVLHLEELLHFLTEKIRHLNGAVAFLGLIQPVCSADQDVFPPAIPE